MAMLRLTYSLVGAARARRHVAEGDGSAVRGRWQAGGRRDPNARLDAGEPEIFAEIFAEMRPGALPGTRRV